MILFILFLSVVSLSWISALLNKSHKQGTLHLTDLYDLLPDYKSINLTEELEINWFDEIKQHPDRASLFRATIRTVRWKPLFIGSTLLPLVSVLKKYSI